MLVELEVSMRTQEAKENKKKKPKILAAGARIVASARKVMGGVEINEEDFEDENLCQICCFKAVNVEYVPC
jgi:hypothetical protein